MTALAVPLLSEQINAANRLRDQVTGWVDSDGALSELAGRFPGFDRSAVLLKVVTINALYGTNVYAVMRMAEHVREVLSRCELATAGPELVEELARLPATGSDPRPRRFHSFASKFAHFFIDAERFPILDDYAERMVKLHLGRRNIHRDDTHRYVAFVRNFEDLKRLAGWSGSARELDHYFWLAGQYRAWKRNPNAVINSEIKRLFASPPPDLRAELDALVPVILDDTSARTRSHELRPANHQRCPEPH